MSTKKYITISCILCCLVFECNAQILSWQDSLEQILTGINDTIDLPGFAVALISAEKIEFARAYGYAQIDTEVPYTKHTIQYMGSVTKVVLGSAIAHAVESDQLQLDTPINAYLPFKIQHPLYPDIPITLRHLVTHTSGLRDGKHYGKSYVPLEKIELDKKTQSGHFHYRVKQQQKNIDMSMTSFLESIYNKDGKWYSKKNFTKAEPGSDYHYINNNAALAALVLEGATGRSFDDYCAEYIFTPLAMTNSHWTFATFNLSDYATPYWYDHSVFPRYKLITYPDGGLLCSMEDLSLFAKDIINGYHGDGIMESSTYKLLLDPMFEGGDNPGIFWDNTDAGWRAHGGGDPGTYTLLFVNPEEKIAKIFFTNIFADFSDDLKKQIRTIWSIITDYEAKIKQF